MTSTRRPTASSKSARAKQRGSSFSGESGMPESWYLRTDAGPLDDSSSGWACTVSRRNWSTCPTLARLRFMKVAFVGSLSTGKTTLANLFAREWDYPLLPEVAREVVELGFPLDQSATAETETLIFLRQWIAESEHERFVADRSIYDVLA